MSCTLVAGCPPACWHPQQCKHVCRTHNHVCDARHITPSHRRRRGSLRAARAPSASSSRSSSASSVDASQVKNELLKAVSRLVACIGSSASMQQGTKSPQFVMVLHWPAAPPQQPQALAPWRMPRAGATIRSRGTTCCSWKSGWRSCADSWPPSTPSPTPRGRHCSTAAGRCCSRGAAGGWRLPPPGRQPAPACRCSGRCRPPPTPSTPSSMLTSPCWPATSRRLAGARRQPTRRC
jgi:hypothetical protein